MVVVLGLGVVVSLAGGVTGRWGSFAASSLV